MLVGGKASAAELKSLTYFVTERYLKYTIFDNQVFLGDSDGADPVSSMDVWRNENEPGSSTPSLSEVGLWFNESVASVFVKLEKGAVGSCGIVSIYVKDTDANVVRLASGHRADHVVVNDAFTPIALDAFSGIMEGLHEAGIIPGSELSLKQYLSATKKLSGKDWFVQEWMLDAKELSSQMGQKFHAVQPRCFTADLTGYQVQGSNWLSMMVRNGIGSILGDGMGLGKTVQAIKAICDELDYNPDAQILVICPSALVENWRREILKFTLGLDVQCHLGSDRTGYYRDLIAPIVITTYDVARIDRPILSQIRWDILILDEAQYIKNPESKRTKAIKMIPRSVSVAVTGTPFENRMTDIWSIMDFCCPGFLGSQSDFCSRFQDEELSADTLGEIIAPFLLRRKLSDIPNDLPDLVRVPMPIMLQEAEAFEYEARRLQYKAEGATLGSINKLIGDLSAPVGSAQYISSLKYDYLRSVAEEVFGNGEKMIVFANRLQGVAYMESAYSKQVPTFVLNGSIDVGDRVPMVDEFSGVDGAALLICNPTVGGAGLNITAANHVFHFSPQWNPAVIDQADARAHRRGQDKPVVVHYPYYVSTIEEYMWDKVMKKRELSQRVSVGNNGLIDRNEIQEALGFSPVGKE